MAGFKSRSVVCASGVADSFTDEGCLWSLSGYEVLPSSFLSSEDFSVPLVVASQGTPDNSLFGSVVCVQAFSARSGGPKLLSKSIQMQPMICMGIRLSVVLLSLTVIPSEGCRSRWLTGSLLSMKDVVA